MQGLQGGVSGISAGLSRTVEGLSWITLGIRAEWRGIHDELCRAVVEGQFQHDLHATVGHMHSNCSSERSYELHSTLSFLSQCLTISIVLTLNRALLAVPPTIPILTLPLIAVV